MFVGLVERGCRTLAVGAMELAWVLIGGEATNCCYRSPPYCTSTEGRRVHCMYSNGKADLQLLAYYISLLSRGGNGFGRGAGLRKVCSCSSGAFEEMVKSIRTRSMITWISCCLL